MPKRSTDEHILRCIERLRIATRAKRQPPMLEAEENFEFIRRLGQYEPDTIEQVCDRWAKRMPTCIELDEACRKAGDGGSRRTGGNPRSAFDRHLRDLGIPLTAFHGLGPDNWFPLFGLASQLSGEQFRSAYEHVKAGGRVVNVDGKMELRGGPRRPAIAQPERVKQLAARIGWGDEF